MQYTMSTHEVIEKLKSSCPGQFTYHERRALAEFYEQLEDDLGETIEFDGVAIRCAWGIFPDLGSVGTAYGHLLDEFKDQHEQEFKWEVKEEFLEWLQNEHGFYIIYQKFGENDYGWQDDHPQGWMILVAEHL